MSEARRPFRSVDLVGIWRFVVTEELEARIREGLSRKIADGAELAAALRDALEEAHASEIELFADGRFASRAGATEWYRVPFPCTEEERTELVFDGPGGLPIRVVQEDDRTLRITKGSQDGLVFRRKG
jgi:hypothetical protein